MASGPDKADRSRTRVAADHETGLLLEFALPEELQASAEELRSANDELLRRNEALSRLNSDIRNLLESAAITMLFLDPDLRIRNFTPDDVAGLIGSHDMNRGASGHRFGDIGAGLTERLTKPRGMQRRDPVPIDER